MRKHLGLRRALGHVLLSSAIAAVSGALAASALAAPIVLQSSVSTAPVDVVYRGDQITPFLQAANTRRVDIAGIGDSNQIFGGDYGHDHGYQKAWSDRFGMYASEVSPANATGGFVVMGVQYSPGHGFIKDGTDPALPSSYLNFAPVNADGFGFPVAAGFVPAGEKNTNGAVFYVGHDAAFYDINSNLRWHSTYYPFANGSGNITLQVRGSGDAKYGIQPIQTYPTTTIQASNDTMVDISQTFDKSIWTKGAGDWKLYLYDYEASLTNQLPRGAMNGPLYSVWQRMENVDRTKGIAYSTLLYQGGKCARDAALALMNAPDQAVAEWMRQEVKLQNTGKSDAMMLVQILHGGNDRNYTAPAVGPDPSPSNTGAGFKSNVTAIITRLRQVWSAQGYDTKNLFFSVGPYHPQAGEEDKLAAFEQGAMQLADETYNLSVVRGTKMISAQTMRAQGLYDSGGDAHLTKDGYETIGRFAVNQLVSLLDPNNAKRSKVSSLSFRFDQDLTGEMDIDPDLLILDNTTTGQHIAGTDMSVSYDAAAKNLTWTFPGLAGDVLPVGHYVASLRSTGAATTSASGATTPATWNNYAFQFTAFGASITPLPEPAGLLGASMMSLLVMRRQRRNQPTA